MLPRNSTQPPQPDLHGHSYNVTIQLSFVLFIYLTCLFVYFFFIFVCFFFVVVIFVIHLGYHLGTFKILELISRKKKNFILDELIRYYPVHPPSYRGPVMHPNHKRPTIRISHPFFRSLFWCRVSLVPMRVGRAGRRSGKGHSYRNRTRILITGFCRRFAFLK